MNTEISAISPGSPRNAALDSLRSFITLLVVAHHAVLAYFPYAPPLGAFDGNEIWGAFPIIDAAKGKGLDILVLWNDTFFMALMFLLSGLFVGPSLTRKRAGGFVRDRLVRLGLPFVWAAFVLAPLAYYPAYLQRADETVASDWWEAWSTLPNWPAGPAWFLWVLIVFGCATALLYRCSPGFLERFGVLAERLRERPMRSAGVLMGLAVLAYVPLTRFYDPMHWSSWGPFFIQTSRVLLYALYFSFGVGLGWRGGLGTTLAAPDGKLARKWIGWQVTAGLVFTLFVVVMVMMLIRVGRGESVAFLGVLTPALFAVTGVATSFMLLSYFARRRSVSSRFWSSLSRNAFAMYLIHYGVVSWSQYGLLSVNLSGWAKAIIVTTVAILVSWVLAAGLRRIPALDRIL